MGPDNLRTERLYSLGHTLAAAYLHMYTYPWEAVRGLKAFVRNLRLSLGEDYEERGEGVFVHRTAHISPTALIEPPCVIGAGSEVRQACLRGGVLVGEGCVVGNAVEVKESILFDGVSLPHLSYVGDSILGFGVHLGAGAIVSNLKSDRSEVTLSLKEEKIFTGLRKAGAFLGDGTEVGCGAVLCPGPVTGKGVRIYPLVLARGAYPPDVIVKKEGVFRKR